jgi:hypothetical protein
MTIKEVSARTKCTTGLIFTYLFKKSVVIMVMNRYSSGHYPARNRVVE